METTFAAASMGSAARLRGKTDREDVVEIGLLLPVGKARALIDLSRRRRQPVAEILRSLISRALDQESTNAAGEPTA